jgi:hypothetical protein
VDNAVDDHRLPGDEVRGRRAEEDHGADDVLRHLIALDRPRRDRDVPELLDHFGVRPDALGHGEAGCDAVDVDRVLPEFPRERPRQRDDGALRGHVVEEERHAAKGRAGRDVHDLPSALLAHHRDDRAAREEHRRDVDLHHVVPLVEGDLGERAHLERGVEAGVVDEDVDAAISLERLSDHPLDVLL